MERRLPLILPSKLRLLKFGPLLILQTHFYHGMFSRYKLTFVNPV
jgi:hypothetical protein